MRAHGGVLTMTNALVADNHGDFGMHLNGNTTLLHVTVGGNDGGILFNTEEGDAVPELTAGDG